MTSFLATGLNSATTFRLAWGDCTSLAPPFRDSIACLSATL
jgi:hypothetical protein